MQFVTAWRPRSFGACVSACALLILSACASSATPEVAAIDNAAGPSTVVQESTTTVDGSQTNGELAEESIDDADVDTTVAPTTETTVAAEAEVSSTTAAEPVAPDADGDANNDAPTATTAAPTTAAPTTGAPTTAAPTTEAAEPTIDPDSPLNGEFTTVGGQSIELASLQGQDVVLWFWAPW